MMRTKTNHLTFTSEQFLRLLKDLDHMDEVFVILNEELDVWRGSNNGISHTISFVNDPRERLEILGRFCPVFPQLN